jgi:hypothetical protein
MLTRGREKAEEFAMTNNEQNDLLNLGILTKEKKASG